MKNFKDSFCWKRLGRFTHHGSETMQSQIFQLSSTAGFISPSSRKVKQKVEKKHTQFCQAEWLFLASQSWLNALKNNKACFIPAAAQLGAADAVGAQQLKIWMPSARQDVHHAELAGAGYRFLWDSLSGMCLQVPSNTRDARCETFIGSLTLLNFLLFLFFFLRIFFSGPISGAAVPCEGKSVLSPHEVC